MKIKKIILLTMAAVTFSGCEDMFEPAVENYRDRDVMYEEANFALGILLNGYTRIPTNSWSFNDVATDDAVSNDVNNSYRKMATGTWSAIVNPVDAWTNCMAGIQYMNIMLEEADKVNWSTDEDLKRMFNDRTKGEAYALRGLFMYYLLRAHAGSITEGGQIMGVPILRNSLGAEDNYNLPRESFDACIEQINMDFDEAEKLLPLDFTDISTDAEVPEKYEGISKESYNRVFGVNSRQRITKRIVEAMRAKTALLAASPAYNLGEDITKWQTAAALAAKVIDRSDVNFDVGGLQWYLKPTSSNGDNSPEILWRNSVGGTDNNLEKDNYPPTLFGNGRINPTQNLVDAFPMANGYPITDEVNSGYKASDPYVGRDPRLAKFIVYNESKLGPGTGDQQETITTVGYSTNDGVNQTETSTRTGYYMRKLLIESINLDPTATTAERHIIPHIRYTEMFLTYAEAANEAYGPKGKAEECKYTAYEIIKKIRERAGICSGTTDPYLDNCATDKVAMRELIRNERRLELCFEGFRFWDLRRWKVDIEKLTETARGINKAGGTSYEPFDVENRNYKEHMYYGPISYAETLKWSELKQNFGW